MQDDPLANGQSSHHAHRVKGRLLKIAGIGLFLVAAVFIYISASYVVEHADSENRSPQLIFGIVTTSMVPLIWYGRKLVKHGKQLTAPDAAVLLSKDTSPPILYLRCFADDEETATDVGPTGLLEAMLSPTGSPLLYFFNKTEEEHLARIFLKFGNCVAIGKPGEELPPLGMVREYLPLDNWQPKVTELMSRARVIIFRAGDTDNFWWEVKEAVRLVKPERLLFVLPFPTNPALLGRESSRYAKFRQGIEKVIPCELPNFQGLAVKEGSLTGVVFFGPGWTPHVVSFSSLGLNLPLKTLLKKALKPFFAQLKQERFE